MHDIICNFITDDMEQTLEFYCDLLGFRIINTIPKDKPYRWVSLGKDKGTIMFQTRESMNEETGLWQQEKLRATMNLYIIVEDIKALYRRVHESVEIVTELKTTYYNMREFTMRDNNGYVLTFGAQN